MASSADRKKTLCRLLIGAVVLINVGCITNSEAPVEYAKIKSRSCHSCKRDSPDFSFLKDHVPVRGAIFAHGSFHSNVARWVIADLDQQKISDIRTVVYQDVDGKRQLRIVENRDVFLGHEDLMPVIQAANRLWDPPPLPKPNPASIQGSYTVRMVLDSVSFLYLFDNDDILKASSGGGWMEDNAEKLTDILLAILKRP